MKAAGFLSLLLIFSLSALGADAPRSSTSVQTGKMSTVHLLAMARVAQPTPDGLRFLFLVKPGIGVNAEKPTIKETRDFTVEGQSYQQKSLVALGRKYEPSTAFDSAEGFFAKQPGARSLAPSDIKGAHVLSITMGGAPLTTGASGEIVIHFGFGLEAEDFTFSFRVPPNTQQAGRAIAAPVMSGLPSTPLEGHTRYVAAEGVAFAPWTLDLKIAGATVSGAIFQHRSDATTGMATNATGPFAISDGKVEGDIVTFKAKTPGGERTITFVGKISGNEIRFTRSVETLPGANAGANGILGGGGATQFVAKRAAP